MRGAAAIVAAALVGCGGGDGPVVDVDAGADAAVESVPICDGSDEIVLAIQLLAGGPLVEGSAVLFDHGHMFLFVDGNCEYYAHAGQDLGDVHRGALASDAELSASLRLDVFEDRQGDYWGDAADGATLAIWHAGTSLRCTGQCVGDGIPGWLAELRARSYAAINEAYGAGEPPELPQRVAVVEHNRGDASPIHAWPASVDPSTIAGAGESVLFDGADGDALRSLRRAAASAFEIYVSSTPEVQPPEYRVYIRDAIPWEGANGIVPLDEATAR